MLLPESMSHHMPWPELVILSDVVRQLTSQAGTLGIERLPLSLAGGRILATPVRAEIDLPQRDAAAMDGYALGRDSITDGALRWRLVEGADVHDAASAADWAVRVTTGARLPPDTRQVLPIEHAEVSPPWVTLRDGPLDRSYIRARGSDLRRGDVALTAGRRIDPRALVAAAAANVATVAVQRIARVAVLVRGDDLADPGAPTSDETAETAPDVLGDALRLFVAEWGGLPIVASRIREDPVALTSAVAALRDKADVIVLVGGAAHGARDSAKTALGPLGLALVCDRLAIRPGRPTWYGRIGETHVLALPGNPTAAMTVARLLLAPLLAQLGGGDALAALAWEPLPLLSAVPETGMREAFLCAAGEGAGVRILNRRMTSDQMMLASADRLVARPAGGPGLPAGAEVPTLRF